MTWSDLTVEQYQGLYPIIMDNSEDFNKEVRAICYLSGMNEDELNNLSLEEYGKIAKNYEFLDNGELKNVAQKTIVANGNKYDVQYDMKKLPVARYVEFKHFVRDKGKHFVPELHFIMASITKPHKQKYVSTDHSKYAEDFKKAKFEDVHATALFFCALLSKMMRATSGYLVKEIVKTGKMDSAQAQQFVRNLMNALDGFTTSSGLQISKA